MSILIGIFVIIFVLYLIKGKVKIDIRSFFRRSLPLDRGKFGVYCFTGKQGTGKTYGLVKFILRNKFYRTSDYKIYSNVTLTGIEYTKINDLDHLLSLRNVKNCFIIFDEIFTLISKTRKVDRMKGADLEEFLSQMRKQKNIFMTTAQEWLNLDIEFRRYVRIQIECKTIPLGKLGGIFIESYFDTTQIKWSNELNEYESPLVDQKISKYEKQIMLSYDTNERIKPLK